MNRGFHGMVIGQFSFRMIKYEKRVNGWCYQVRYVCLANFRSTCTSQTSWTTYSRSSRGEILGAAGASDAMGRSARGQTRVPCSVRDCSPTLRRSPPRPPSRPWTVAPKKTGSRTRPSRARNSITGNNAQ